MSEYGKNSGCNEKNLKVRIFYYFLIELGLKSNFLMVSYLGVLLEALRDIVSIQLSFLLVTYCAFLRRLLLRN